MDSNDLERERGITIMSKNTSIHGNNNSHSIEHARPCRILGGEWSALFLPW